MPDVLKKDSWCPMCGRDIYLVTRTTTRSVDNPSTLEFSHDNIDEDCVLTSSRENIDRIHKRMTV